MKNIVCFGELLIRIGARENQSIGDLGLWAPFVGGAEANVAIGLANYGHQSKMISIIPDNDLGDAALAFLMANKVDCSDVVKANGRMGLYFLSPGSGLKPSEIIYDRQNSSFANFDFTKIDWSRTFESADLFHVSGVTAALGEAAYSAAKAALFAARTKGIQTSYDCNYRPKLWENWSINAPDLIVNLMSEANIIFGSQRDFELVFRRKFKDDKEASSFAFSKFSNLQIIASTPRNQTNATTNELSGLLQTRQKKYISKGYEIVSIVDRIGSGDAFAAGLLSQLLEDNDMQGALDFGVASAALKHYQNGDACRITKNAVLGLISETGFDVKR